MAAFSILKGEELARAHAVESDPYPDPPVSRRTVKWGIDRPLPRGRVLKSWEFAGSASEGWIPYQVMPFVVRGGVLSTTATGDDPQLIVDNVGVTVEDLECIAWRLRVAKGVSSCQLFWTTAAEPGMTADKCFTLPASPDGRWHEYQVSKEPEGKWSGPLRILRLDAGGAGDTIEVDWVRLYGKAR